jgi:hypothetical protein
VGCGEKYVSSRRVDHMEGCAGLVAVGKDVWRSSGEAKSSKLEGNRVNPIILGHC